MPEKEIIIEIALERLRDFPGSPFSVAMDEPMKDLIGSIQTYGILNPLIVRPMPDGCYQIISGHRRKFAAAKLKYRKLPVIIRALNDDEALVAMVDSNLQREKIRVSEKAFAYRMKYDVVKREGKHPKEYFYGEKYHGIKTIEFMGKEQKDSPKQVQRMLNVTRLIPELLKKLDKGKFGFTPAAELALLCKEEQYLLNDAMEYTQSAPTLSQAIRIKHIADREDLTMDHLVRILNENNKKVLKRVVFADDAIYQYFSPEESPQEIKEEILKMLQEKKDQRKAGSEAKQVILGYTDKIRSIGTRGVGNPGTGEQGTETQRAGIRGSQNREPKGSPEIIPEASQNRRMSREAVLEILQNRYNIKLEQPEREHSERKEETANV